jgi:hypothetical protein
MMKKKVEDGQTPPVYKQTPMTYTHLTLDPEHGITGFALPCRTDVNIVPGVWREVRLGEPPFTNTLSRYVNIYDQTSLYQIQVRDAHLRELQTRGPEKLWG